LRPSSIFAGDELVDVGWRRITTLRMVVRLSLLESKVPLRRRVWPAGCGGAKHAIKKMFTPARFIDAVEYGGSD
jgi:hypothetical protein